MSCRYIITSSLHSAFTLLELCITLALIAIICSFALVNYQNTLIKSRRHTAKVALLEAAQRLEHYYFLYHEYSGANLQQLGINEITPSGYYRLQLVTATAQQFVLAAIPQQAQQHDIACGTLSINQALEVNISGNKNVAACWN